MTDAEPFTLRRELAPRRPEAKPLAIVATRQASLFDPGRNDLPGQSLMFPDIGVQGDPKNLSESP